MTGERPRTLMGWIVHSSLRLRFVVVALAIGMMVLGALQIQNMRLDAFPEFAPPRVEIQTASLGLSTADVETLVTVPLEQALNGIKGLDEMRSKSVPQLSSIELIFKPGADLLESRQLVQERLANVQGTLPTWAAPPVMLPPVSATSRVMQIGMTSRAHSLIAMSMMAYWTVRARLLRVDGVANVAIWGERLQMLTVQVDPHALNDHNVGLTAVMEATSDSVDSGLLKFSSASVIGTGGAVEGDGKRLGIRHVLPIVTPADLARVTVLSRDDKPVRMDQVAEVKEDHQPLIGDAVIGTGPGLLLVIEKLPWGNTLSITRGIEEALNKLQPGLPDITFDTTIFRQSTFIETAVHNLAQALLLGFILVAGILSLFLFEWRTALISWLTIPLSLMAALLVLYWRGDTLNTMTLAGIVIGLGAVVDDAVIGVENILRRLRQSRLAGEARSTASVILDATLEVRSPIIYATLIIVAAAVPVFLLEGLTGAFFRPLAVSYTLAIMASLVVALTLTPALALILLGRTPVERHHSPVTLWLQRLYARAMDRIVRRPRGAYGTFAALALSAALIVPHLGQSLFPAFREHNLLIHWIAPPGTSVDEERRMVTRLSEELGGVPGVQSFGSHIGQAFLGEEVQGVNFGENWISIDQDADRDRVEADVRSIAGSYPGLYHDVTTYLNERVEEVLTGAKEPIVVRIFGPDLGVLRARAAEVQAGMAAIPGIADNHVDLVVDVPQIQVEVDLARAARYGLKPGDVRRAASTLVAGEEVGDVFRDGKTYDVVVWSTPATRANVAEVEDLMIDTPDGPPIRLGDVAKVSLKPVPNLIERNAGSRRIDVVANVRNRDLGAAVRDVDAVLARVQFQRGYHAELLGEFKEREEAQQRLFGVAVVAALAILLLLQTAFGSWRLGFLIFLTLPMALVGGVLAAFFTGGVITLGSLLGFFTVFGIAARNGILLVNHAQHLQTVEGEAFGAALVVRAARERLAPILMTSLATGLGIVPLVVLGDRPGHEIEYPLAVVILGGLVTSTLLNLFAVPALYLRFGAPRSGVSAGAS